MAQASIGQGDRLALSVPGNMKKIQFTEWRSNSAGTDSEWNSQLSAGKVHACSRTYLLLTHMSVVGFRSQI